MDRLGVQLDQTILDRQGLIPSSKGLLTTNSLIYYLANRGLDEIGCLKAGRRDWWSLPNRPESEGPLRSQS